MPSLTEILERFRRFGPEQASGPFGSPLYVALCAGVAADPETAALLLDASPAQQIPNLLLASVHDLLLAGGRPAAHRLAHYYPTVAGPAAAPPDSGTYPAFRHFCSVYAKQLRLRIRTRSTQTNEPRRAALLLPAFGVVASESGLPLALLEAGASAGLLLQPDRYAYDYDIALAGDPASPLQLSCQLVPPLDPPLPERLPVAWRAGIDLAPVDVVDPDAVRWLAALLWPEHAERAAHLRAAIGLARADPPRVIRGDMVDGLAALVAEVPGDAALAIFHATSLVYLAAERRRSFVDRVAWLAAHHHRAISLVSCEAAGVLETIGADLLDGLPGELPPGPSCAILLWRFDPAGHRSHRLLGVGHPHGRWLRWVDAASARAAG